MRMVVRFEWWMQITPTATRHQTEWESADDVGCGFRMLDQPITMIPSFASSSLGTISNSSFEPPNPRLVSQFCRP